MLQWKCVVGGTGVLWCIATRPAHDKQRDRHVN